MPSLSEPFYNRFLVGECCFAQISQDLQEAGVTRRLGFDPGDATKTEQQREQPLHARSVALHYL